MFNSARVAECTDKNCPVSELGVIYNTALYFVLVTVTRSPRCYEDDSVTSLCP